MKRIPAHFWLLGAGILAPLMAAMIWWWMPSVSQQDVAALNKQMTLLRQAEAALYAHWLHEGSLTSVTADPLLRALKVPGSATAPWPPYGGTLQITGREHRFALQISKVPLAACEYLALVASTDFVQLQAIPSPRQFDRLHAYYEDAPAPLSARTVMDLLEGHSRGRLHINNRQAGTPVAAQDLCQKGGNTLRWTLAFPDENAALLEKMGLSRSFAPN